jgi:antibiotic biosynthesis monooxygenase (ABM) superfamily enzyme
MLAGAGAAAAVGTAPAATKQPIQLYCDLMVDPKREEEMLKAFRETFRPAATKFPGYIDVRIQKFRTAFQNQLPKGVNYRFQLTYESEELRQKWIASPTHKKVWPMIENTLLDKKNYPVLLFDDVTSA